MIRSKNIQLYKKQVQRERFVRREFSRFEQAINKAKAEFEMTLRRFARGLEEIGSEERRSA